MRSLLFFPFAFSAVSLLAVSDIEERVSLLECKMEKVRGESVYPCRNGARFASGRPVTAGYNLSAFLDVLCWKFYEGGLDYAVKNNTVTNIIGGVEKLKFDWETGFRLGASYGFSDNWDFTASFTHVKTDCHDQKHGPVGGTLDPFSPFGVDGSYGSIREDLKYSVVNFEIGSSYFVSRSFYLRPHFGAQGAWIHQKIQVCATPHSVFNRFQNEFNGGGLRAGLDTKWFFDSRWNLVFNAAASALYGTCNVSMRSNSSYGVAHTGADVNRLVPSVQSLIGLCWETNFTEDTNHISLLLAYENSYWWRQNQLIRLENDLDQPPYGTRLSEDLGSQGLTFDLTLFF
jgi:hypothetical protein